MNWPTITKDTPIEEIKIIHQQIWDHAVKHVDKPNTPYLNNCAACQYYIAAISPTLDMDCYKRCPIFWGEKKYHENIRCSDLYCDWSLVSTDLHSLYDPERAAKLAKQIRDIPFKFELIEITSKE